MAELKYRTHEERKEARRRQKREWARRNKEKNNAYFKEWYKRQKAKRAERTKYTTEELIQHIEEIKKDLIEMGQRKAAVKWGRHRKTLTELVKRHG